MGESRGLYMVLVGKPEGKRALGKTRLRIKDNIKRDFFRKWDVEVWTGSSCLRIGTGGGKLFLRRSNFGFYKTWGII
jgi:hypothetical protein